MEHEDIIHRLQVIRDQIRYSKTFEADVKLNSLQRMLAEKKLTSDNSSSCGSAIASPKLPAENELRQLFKQNSFEFKKQFFEIVKRAGNFT